MIRNKRLFRIFVLACVTCILSCGKQVSISGTIYSKNNIPIPDVKINLEEYKNSDYPFRTNLIATTDKDGNFMVSTNLSNRRRYELNVNCDSGWYRSPFLEKSSPQIIDIHLK